MQVLKNLLERVLNIWKNMSKVKKMILIGAVITFIVLLVVVFLYAGKKTYVPLFNEMTVEDAGTIAQSLDAMGMKEGVDYKLNEAGNEILIEESKAGRTRMDLSVEGSVPVAGIGFEIFDETSFTLTSEDRAIKVQRALQGELERSIMTIEEVDYAKVLINTPKNSVFAKEKETGSASVTLKLKNATKLKEQQVAGIVRLVSGALDGVPAENVIVVDSNANLLTADLGDKEISQGTVAVENLSITKQYEKDLSDEITSLLESAFGYGKVVVKVNAQLNFDKQESVSTQYGEEEHLRSGEMEFTKENGAETAIGLSPVDNNTQYFWDPNTADTPDFDSYKVTINNELDTVVVNNVKAPGYVDNVSTSVIVDGKLTNAKKLDIENIVKAATGYSETRGDQVNVSALEFDTTIQSEMITQMEESMAAENRREMIQNIALYVGLAVSLIILLIAFLILRKKFAKQRPATFEGEMSEFEGGFDAMVGEEMHSILPIEEVLEDATLKLSPNKENVTEKEIKNFAGESPDKVAEIIKTWILKDEV